MLNASIFRENDIRGLAAHDLSSPVAFAIGFAFTELLSEQLASPTAALQIAVGRDARLSGPRILSAFEAGVHAAGARTVNLGLAPTPLVYFALCEPGLIAEVAQESGEELKLEGCHGGAVITGSHNPPEWNGFKLCVGNEAAHGEVLQELRVRVEAKLSELSTPSPLAGLLPRSSQRCSVTLTSSYAAQLASRLSFGSRRLKVVVDGGSGALGPCALALFARLPLEVIPLYCEPDGRFPHHHPDPTVEENLSDLKARVIAEGADLGVAFDGDGDRLGVVDQLGRVLWGDQLMIFFARALLEQEPGARIIGEVKCSQLLYDEISALGGVPEMWRVGHSLIKARMRETGAPLAGEMSGHIFFADRFYGHDDAAYVAARLFELLSHGERSLAELRDALPSTYTTPELRVECPDELKASVISRARDYFSERYEVISVDGVRVLFPDGWGLIRASNTQPVLVLRLEASSEQGLMSYVRELERWLQERAPEVRLKQPLYG